MLDDVLLLARLGVMYKSVGVAVEGVSSRRMRRRRLFISPRCHARHHSIAASEDTGQVAPLRCQGLSRLSFEPSVPVMQTLV